MISVRYKKYFIFLLLISAQVPISGMTGQGALQAKLGTLKDRLTELKGKLSALQKQLGRLKRKTKRWTFGRNTIKNSIKTCRSNPKRKRSTKT